MTPLALTAIAVISALAGAAQAGVGLGELALIGGVGIFAHGPDCWFWFADAVARLKIDEVLDRS